MIKLEKTVVANMNTPTKCPQICTTPQLKSKKFPNAPTKKDIIPKHLKKDLEETKLSRVSHSLIFSSSEDEKYSITPEISVSPKVNPKVTRIRKNLKILATQYLNVKVFLVLKI
ncbi:hypothetical protein TNCT_59801 [Trichonephila clavata]|uniref:Uncharacterized protein n=1 Tax=Trichonephila clavata TaxID=2740835 RepID=A0A8X6J9G6_TRICU|nr:hypothetical protein TNCT_59801 [Trichonephila clavata]